MTSNKEEIDYGIEHQLLAAISNDPQLLALIRALVRALPTHKKDNAGGYGKGTPIVVPAGGSGSMWPMCRSLCTMEM